MAAPKGHQKGMSRLKEELSQLKGQEHIYTVKDLLEYFKPKLARQEHKTQVVTRFKFVKNNNIT